MGCLHRGVIAGLLLLCSAMSAAAERCQQTQLDKSYQQVLYYYFQRDFFQALSQFERLADACPQSLEQITNPGINPSLLKGAMSLSYGLHLQAAEIFQRLLITNTDPAIQTRTWLWLGRAMFAAQQYQPAAKALQQINLAAANQFLEPADKDEWLYLQSQLAEFVPTAMAAVNHSGADQLAEYSSQSVYRRYVMYNRAVAHLQANQTSQAVQILEQLSQSPSGFLDDFWASWWTPLNTDSEQEIAALTDRANLTLGYAHLKNQQALQAFDAFDRIRVDSLDTDAALLGFGWAAAQREEYQVALSAWQRLQALPRSNEYVLESYLASAYAFEQAFAPTQAVNSLQQGLNRFAAESQQLRRSGQQINDQYFIQLALQDDWSEQIPAHLSAVMLSREFRNQLDWLGETLQMRAQLSQWQTRLANFRLMLDERQRENQQRSSMLQQSDLLHTLATYIQRRDQLAQVLSDAERQPLLLANQQELAWLQRLSGALQRHQAIVAKRQQLNQSPLADSYAARLQRIEGILVWELAQDYPRRRWQSQKALNQVDQAIANTTAQQSALQQRLQQPPAYQLQRNRIAELDRKLASKLGTLTALQNQQLGQLNVLLQQQISQQLAQLDDYKLQAQLAIVRLNDKAFRKAQADKQGTQ